MVTVVDFLERKNREGETFNVMIVESNPEIIKSQNGKFYARTMKATIPSTFNEEVGRKLIGRKFNGKIERVPCEPYMHVVNGEETELSFTYQYCDEKTLEELVFGEGVR